MAIIQQTIIIVANDNTELTLVKAYLDISGVSVESPIPPILSRIDNNEAKTVTITCDLGTRIEW